ncbi:unnamed protein product [Spirodela intermedia]|uniref:Uncharacterized protein n=1 Tax=Spirodela intermedia TaxID=51605 RepID=A0ABN7ECI2_SPIIN|nr:unnamed protein product [Spirodela intermedia]
MVRDVEQLTTDVERLNQVNSNVKNMKEPVLLKLQLADGSIKQPYGMLKDVMVKVEHCTFSVDFIVADMKRPENWSRAPIISGRPFLATAKA